MERENNNAVEENLVAAENGGVVVKEVVRAGKTAGNMSTAPLRTKSDVSLISRMVRFGMIRNVLVNIQEVLLGTKLCVLFPAVPLAIASHLYGFARAWVFALSLIGLTPLAERVSFLTEQIAHYTGPTVGGLVNATCGNVTELIIAILALSRGKIDVVKYSLLGSILSNLLLVLGSSLFFGGLANLTKEQTFDRKQADVNCLLLLLALFCHMMPLLFKKAFVADDIVSLSTLNLSRGSSIFMLIAYFAYLVFQLWTHRPLFEPTEVCDEDETGLEEEAPVVSFWSGFAWLVGMTAFIALLSEYVVGTIEDASESWGISVSFISIILLPIVGNAAEHAGAIIFALKNKLDISLGVALGSATQISMFAVPVCIIVSWIMGVKMDLDLSTIETGSLACSIIITSFALQDGSSHYMKGLILLLCYVVIGVCFICLQAPLRQAHLDSMPSNNQPIGFNR